MPMACPTLLRLVLAFSTIATLCLAQATTTLDDVDPSISYSGSWEHQDAGVDYLYKGTQSWTNDPAATISFSFQGTGFDFCAGLKSDRGTFSYSVDGTPAGTGTQAGTSMTEAQCANVASVRNLDAGEHSVVITNTGGAYLAADSFTIYTDGPVAATLEPSSSQTARARASSTTSFTMSPLPSSSGSSTATSSSIGKATISAANRTVSKEEGEGVSSGKKAAMIGGSIAGGIVAAILFVVGFWLFRRRQANKRDSMLFPDSGSVSARDLDEKNFGSWHNEKRPLSTAAGPAGGLPRTFGVPKNLHKRNISRQDSLEARTSAFQPETLRNQPAIEPFYPAQFTPSHSANHSLSSSVDLQPVFNSPPRNNQPQHNVAHPFDVSPLKTKTSYENRLAAASASLPDWHTRPIPRSNQSNQYLSPSPFADQHRVRSEVSSAYPATEPRGSMAVEGDNRISMAYSGIESEGGGEDPDAVFEDYGDWDSQVGVNNKA